jgi:PAS domain S-box-containing protein
MTDTRIPVEEALGGTSQLLETILEHTPQQIAYLDSRFNFVRVNRAYAQAYERDPLFYVGKNYFDLYPDAEDEAIFQKVVETGLSYSAQAEPSHYRHDPKRGVTHWDWSLVPTRDARGTVVGLVLTQTDVTERERMAQAHRESEELFRTLVESQGEGIGIVDPQERFAFANPAADGIFGVPLGSLIGRSLVEFTDAEQFAAVREQTERRKRGEKSTYEVEIQRPDGERRSLLVTATPRFDQQRFSGTFGVFRDITEQVRTQKALHRAREELERRVEERTAELEQEIEERKHAEETLLQRNHELALLHRSTQAFGSTLDLDHVLVIFLEEVRHLLEIAAGSIWLADPGSGELVCQQSTGRQSNVVLGWRLAPGEGLVGWVAQSGQSLIVSDARADDRHFREIDLLTQMELCSILNVPLRVKGRVIGVLQMLDERPNRFGAADLALLEPLAASAAVAIENARLYKETERLRAFNENIVQGMEEGILLGDAAGHITFANPSMTRLVGYTADQLKELHWKALVVPEDIVEAEKEIARLSGGRGRRLETTVLARDGRQVPVLASLRSIPTADGTNGTLAVLTDITERRRAEEVLRRQNEELVALNAIATAISQTPDLGHILRAALDKVLEVVRMDAGWIQLIDPGDGDAAGDSLSLVAHRGMTSEALRDLETFRLGRGLMAKVIRSRQPVVIDGGAGDVQLDVPGPDGGTAWTLAAVPIQARENVLGVLCVSSHSSRQVVAREIHLLTAIGNQIGMATENLRLLAEASEIQVLRELNRLRSELIANVSHELRTPLGLIKVFASTLLREDVQFDEETRHEFLCDIEEETDKLEELVRNLLDISRMEEGRLRLDKQPTNIGHLAQEVLDDMQGQCAQHNVVLALPAKPLVAPVDAKRIAQVLRNLLSNAIKYSPQGTTVTVQGRSEDGRVLIEVRDQGIGIPEKDLARVFERFYRIDNEFTRKVGGVGLGLALCRGIVEAHDGRIWVESAPGKGSAFSFVLPTRVSSGQPSAQLSH